MHRFSQKRRRCAAPAWKEAAHVSETKNETRSTLQKVKMLYVEASKKRVSPNAAAAPHIAREVGKVSQ